MLKTVMAFDFGTKSIGSAIGQSITATASPLLAFKATDGVPNWNSIALQIKEWQPDLLIVGLPTDLEGNDLAIITDKARDFAKQLAQRFPIEVVMHDEKLSTTEARSELFDRGGYKALTKGKIDNQSAVIILESWFNSNL